MYRRIPQLARSSPTEKSFKAAYIQLPDSSSAYWYGRTLDIRGESALAIPLLEQAVERAPVGFRVWCLRELGIAYGHVGRYAEANAAFDLALQLDGTRSNAERIAAARATVSRPER